MALIMGCVITVYAMITIRIQPLFQLAIIAILMINLRINVSFLQGYQLGFVFTENAKPENLAVIAMKTTIVFLELVLSIGATNFACYRLTSLSQMKVTS